MPTTEHFSENKTKNTMKPIVANNKLGKSQNAKWKKNPMHKEYIIINFIYTQFQRMNNTKNKTTTTKPEQ